MKTWKKERGGIEQENENYMREEAGLGQRRRKERGEDVNKEGRRKDGQNDKETMEETRDMTLPVCLPACFQGLF